MGWFNRTRVFVNGKEVTDSVDPPVKVEIVEPLPDLPKLELPAFTEKPRCSQCRSLDIAWSFRHGFHQQYYSVFTGSTKWDPSLECPIPVRVNPYYTAYGTPEAARREAENTQQRNTVPPHHDLRCERCSYSWVTAAAPVAEAVA